MVPTLPLACSSHSAAALSPPRTAKPGPAAAATAAIFTGVGGASTLTEVMPGTAASTPIAAASIATPVTPGASCTITEASVAAASAP